MKYIYYMAELVCDAKENSDCTAKIDRSAHELIQFGELLFQFIVQKEKKLFC